MLALTLLEALSLLLHVMGVCSSADVVRACVSPEPHPPGQAWLNGGLCIHWNGERERREVGMIEWAA